jgi:hypothetical protein
VQIRLAGVAIQEERRRGRRHAAGSLAQADAPAGWQVLAMALRGAAVYTVGRIVGFGFSAASEARAGKVMKE